MDERSGSADHDGGFNDLSWRAWLGLAWQGVKRWRKKYWLTRVIILRAMAVLGGIVLLGLALVGYGATYGLGVRALYWRDGLDLAVYGRWVALVRVRAGLSGSGAHGRGRARRVSSLPSPPSRFLMGQSREWRAPMGAEGLHSQSGRTGATASTGN